VGHFLRGRARTPPTLAHLRLRSRPAPSASSGRYQVGTGASRTHMSASLLRGRETVTHPTHHCARYRPNPSPSSATTPSVVASQILVDGPSTCHHPHATRMTACPPATLSRRVDCGAPWRPITVFHLCLLLDALPAGEISATPHAKELHPSLCELPSHPFACCLACKPLSSRIAAKVLRHPTAPVDRCQGRYAATIPAPSTRRQGLAQRLCFLLPC
jgi:hypothetical protein